VWLANIVIQTKMRPVIIDFATLLCAQKHKNKRHNREIKSATSILRASWPNPFWRELLMDSMVIKVG